MRYDRRIKYLDYLENGERVRGCGFARLELRDSHLIMDLNIRGLRCAEGLACDVILCSQVKEAAVGKITFYNGEGKFRHECHVENEIGKTGIAYQELAEIRIRVGVRRKRKMPQRQPDSVLTKNVGSRKPGSRGKIRRK